MKKTYTSPWRYMLISSHTSNDLEQFMFNKVTKLLTGGKSFNSFNSGNDALRVTGSPWILSMYSCFSQTTVDMIPLYLSQQSALDALQWICSQHGTQPTNRCSDNAASVGKLELIQWLWEKYHIICSYSGVDKAATNGHLHILQWFWKSHGIRVSDKVLEHATNKGHLKLVRWANKHYKNRRILYSIKIPLFNN